MGKRITHNLGLKIGSAIFAIILWLLVVNTIDPVTTATYSNIQVELINIDAITSQGKVYDVLDDSDNISVTVTANRSVLESLKSSDFVAKADMKEMVVANTVPIEVTCSKYTSYIEEIVPKIKTVKISIEDSASKQFAISAVTTGTPGEGYAVGDVVCSPNVLKVSGPASVVNKISRVVVEADVSDLTTTYNNTLTPKFYDNDGDIIESTRLKYRVSDIAVSIDMLRTKTIDLSFGVIGTPDADYGFVETVCSPETVTVAGSASDLAKITSIEVPNSEVDISDATANVQKMVSIADYLPEGIKLVDADEASVLVTAIIEKLKTKTYDIPIEDIELKNIPRGYSATIISVDSVKIAVKGLEDAIENLKEEDIKLSVDLSRVSTAGTKTLTIGVTLPEDSGVETVGEVTVNVVVQVSQQIGDNN